MGQTDSRSSGDHHR